MSQIVNHFIEHIRDEDETLADGLERLSEKDLELVEGLLKRFNHSDKDALDDQEAGLARRVLDLLHRPSKSGFDRLNQVFDFLDTNRDQVMSFQELLLATELLEYFANADSVNDSLSVKELDMLLAILTFEDKDDNGVLDEEERGALHDALWEPDAYLEEQREKNPHLRKLLSLD